MKENAIHKSECLIIISKFQNKSFLWVAEMGFRKETLF